MVTITDNSQDACTSEATVNLEVPEIIELSVKDHPFFVAVQFHPELQARPLDPHPVFSAFIKAAKK